MEEINFSSDVSSSDDKESEQQMVPQHHQVLLPPQQTDPSDTLELADLEPLPLPPQQHLEPLPLAPQHNNTAVAPRFKMSGVIEILSDSDDDGPINKINNNVQGFGGNNISRKRQRPFDAPHQYGSRPYFDGANQPLNVGRLGGINPLQIRNQMQHPVPMQFTSNNQQMMQYSNIQNRIRQQQQKNYREPIYISLPNGFVPTWNRMLPSNAVEFIRQRSRQTMTIKSYQLSLLNVKEFTITGQSTGYDTPPTSIAGLRPHIKQISRKHGKAVWQRDTDESKDDDVSVDGDAAGEGGGKWRIPLGAYQAFYTFLKSDPMTMVEGIPEIQLKIASLGRERLVKGFPSVKKLIARGLPTAIANALAPFQRGGVDFVIEKNGRALIADDMGLGKTIQAIASMAVYEEEWPLLVLSPSTARYHWESELLNWLGESTVSSTKMVDEDNSDKDNSDKDNLATSGDEDESLEEIAAIAKRPMPKLQKSEVNVLTSAKDAILLRNKDGSTKTRVVICSYGLAPNLIVSGKIRPNQFKCAIVDESHMLKNKSTKRTKTLLPILSAAHRVVLLSGTPAFARPMELWPQLLILKTEQSGWFQSEDSFFSNYVKGGSTRKRAELHTMLTGTVMIRRKKTEILKSLPRKIREQVLLSIRDESLKEEFKACMEMLRKGKGQLANFARKHEQEKAEEMKSEKDNADAQQKTKSLSQSEACGADSSYECLENTVKKTNSNGLPGAQNGFALTNTNSQQLSIQLAAAQEQLKLELQRKHDMSIEQIRQALAMRRHQLTEEQMKWSYNQMEQKVKAECEVYYQQRMQQIKAEFEPQISSSISVQSPPPQDKKESPELSRKTVLSRMYSLTGKAKIPFLIDMLKRWLNDPTKGKLCIFAHHLFVLDALQSDCNLSNEKESYNKFIRIDGSTQPKKRQEQINSFQRDPSVRIALLGITAAGVAVTLTASSDVWFAELFWTPAIMIQAEDRCHRIGQQARVNCLYIVARSTLDELLWKMIEKKLKDLGEFVEGKEKVKLVVDQTYKNERELLAALYSPGLDGLDEDLLKEGGDDVDAILGEIEADDDIQHDIEELGKTEQLMMQARDSEDDEGDEIKPSTDTPTEIVSNSNKGVVLGETEDAAICLSDDEEEELPSRKPMSSEARPLDAVKKESKQVSLTNKSSFDRMKPFPRLRLYKLLFKGASFGVEVSLYQGRIVVKGVRPERVREVGIDAKPSVGDVFVAVGGRPLPVSNDLMPTLQHMQTAIQSPPAEVIFAEDAEFAEDFAKVLALEAELSKHGQDNGSNTGNNVDTKESKEPGKSMNYDRTAGGKAVGSNDAIDLIDD